MIDISIIVPVFNSEKFLNKCIESIINQTFHNYELILINDGSTDNSGIICDKYAKIYPFVSVIHQKNAGVSVARNVGLEASSGNYIMFCDSDDYVESNWCEIMFNTIEKNPNCSVVCNFCKENTSYSKAIPKINKDSNFINKQYYSYFEIYKLGVSFSVCGKIFNRDLIDKLKLRFEVGRPFGEDTLFSIKYMSHFKNFVLVPDVLYHYVDNSCSASYKYYANKYEYILPLFSMRLELIEKKEISNFCDAYFFILMDLLKNTMDSRSDMSILKKFKQNNKIMNTKEFRQCVELMSGEKESKLFLKIIKKHNYYLLWMFEQLQMIKFKLSKKE